MPLTAVFLFSGEEIKELGSRIREQENQLLAIEEQIDRLYSSLKALSRREEKLQKSLHFTEEEIRRNRIRLSETRGEIEKLRAQIEASREFIKEEQLQKSRHSRDLDKLLRKCYYEFRRKSAGNWPGALASGSRDRFYILGCVVKAPAADYVTSTEHIEKTFKETESLKMKNNELKQLKGKLVRVQEDNINKRKSQLAVLEEIRGSQEKRKREIEDMESEKENLRELIESLQYRAENLQRLRQLGQDFSSARGVLSWPVKGDVVSEFGRQKHPRLDTYIYNRGIEIDVPFSSEVRSVAPGEVVYASPFRALGNMVVIDHGNNYYTIYGTLDSINTREGREIDALEPVGKVKGSLYFELGRGSEPQDPLLWLK